MANTSLESTKVNILKDRAHMFAKVRDFFHTRGVLEVDCPALTQASPIDVYIDVMHVPMQSGQKGYLHTSPEYGMKRLLAMQVGDIYQMSHVFREGEIGPLHNPEFTMVEWYRHELTFDQLIDETADFIRLFLNDLPTEKISYRTALKQHAGIDYVTATIPELVACADKHGLKASDAWDKDTLLQFLMCFVVEPHLGQGSLSIIDAFPGSQAALSKTQQRNDEKIAMRYEIYYRGMELANGYHELTDPIEQRRRFVEGNLAREKLGKNTLPIDEHFLKALEQGVPDCCGVAVGFDRLILLRNNKNTLEEVLPFPWPIA